MAPPRRPRPLHALRDRAVRRVVAILAVYLVAFGALGHRLVTVQVLHADGYARVAELQRQRTIELPADRGRLYDRNGDILATSVEAAAVYADPRAFRPRTRDDGLVVPPAADPAEVAGALASLLGTAEETLRARLERDGHFVYLARQVPGEVGDQIRALGLPGIGVLAEPARVYPNGSLAGQVIGFTGIDGDGLAGLELAYEGLLSGRAGRLALERAPGGLVIASAERELIPPTPGTDIVLTLDREVQHVAERAAATAVERHGAKAASVVVLEVGTGEVLAMANVPGFDPGDVPASAPPHRRNRAVTDMFEPGSVQKAITVAAAVEEGIASPDTVLPVPREVVVGRKAFRDAHDHPAQRMTLREVVATSSNVGTILVAQQLGAERLAAYLERFGIGEPLGVGFPGESDGALLPVERWSATSLPTIAIGQGVAVTLLQAAAVYAAIADDGVATQPRLVRGTVGVDGRLDPAPPPARRRVVSAATAAHVREMLAAVVDPEGTGQLAAVLGYRVAGKTGTARKPKEGARGYSDAYIASFVGMAPAGDPQLVVAVTVDEPRPIYGGIVAAPIFSEVAGFALTHQRVPTVDHDGTGASTPQGGGG